MTAFLPDTVRAHITQVVTAMPRVAVELYHDDNTIHALNANDVTRRHMHITHAPSIEVDTMDAVPSPHQQGAVLHGGAAPERPAGLSARPAVVPRL